MFTCVLYSFSQGTGFLSLHFAAAQARVVLTLRLADVDHLPVDDASVDVVCERHVLWTMPEPATTLAEWHRVLRPGDRLLLVEGDWRDRLTDRELDAEDPQFLHRYQQIRTELPLFGGRPSEEVRTLVDAAGFVDARVVPLDERELWEGLDRDNPAPRYLVCARRAP